MHIGLRGPAVIYGLDALIQFFVAFVAFIVAAIGKKAYRLTSNKKFLYFFGAFLLLGFSSLIFAFVTASLFVYYTYYSHVDVAYLLPIAHMLNFFYILSIFWAYTLFIFIYSEVRRKSISALIATLVLALAVYSFIGRSLVAFNLISILLLVFILYYTSQNWFKKKTTNSLLVFLIFGLITLAHLTNVFGIYNEKFYIVGHLLQIVGYLNLFLLFMRVNYAKKKRQVSNNTGYFNLIAK